MPHYESESYIIIRTQIEGTHCWPDCPYEEVAFLRNPHRHLFKIKAIIPVEHDNRALEFFLGKKDIDLFLDTSLANHGNWDESVKDLGDWSCERLGKHIMEFIFEQYGISDCMVEVNEDGENGGLVVGRRI